jgi:hypothetical protein
MVLDDKAQTVLADLGAGSSKEPIDASYKLLVIISQGCATYFADCLFKNTVEAVIQNGDQGYNPA